MTSLNLSADFSSADRTDFVSTDAANLASHMDHCAGAHSRFFALHSALQSVQSVVCPRIVTAAALAALVVIGLGLLTVA